MKKLFGVIVVLAAAAFLVSMYPDFKRYMNIESM